MTSVVLMTEQECQWCTQHESDRCDEALIAVSMDFSLLSICYPMPRFLDCSVLKVESLRIFLNVCNCLPVDMI